MSDDEKSPAGQGEAELQSANNNTASLSSPQVIDAELASILDEIVAALKRHISLPEGAAEATALYVVSTHTLDSASFAVRLVLRSPLPECGKTSLINILVKLVCDPMPASNASPAVIYRMLNQKRLTFIFDEADTFMDGKSELAGIINSGHTRGTAYVLRCGSGKQNFAPERFPTFCAMIIACIGNVGAALETRSIIILMQRKKPGEAVRAVTSADLKLFDSLNVRLAAWAKPNGAKLKDADPKMPDGFSNRRADNWRHLFAIADLAGAEWGQRARKAAALLEGEPENSVYENLFAAIKRVFADCKVSKISSADLAAHPSLPKRTGSTWTPTSLAAALRGFGIRPKSVRIDAHHTPKGYELGQFTDVWERYLDPSSGQADDEGGH